jgi:hypothetical protein
MRRYLLVALAALLMGLGFAYVAPARASNGVTLVANPAATWQTNGKHSYGVTISDRINRTQKSAAVVVTIS